MAKLADVLFEGSSFTKYCFGAYTLDSEFDNGGAVYIFTRRTKPGTFGGTHVVRYIGQSESLSDELNANGGPAVAESRFDANCLCVMYEKDSEIRASIEKDLLKHHITPFNQQT
ncbi:MAG: hypothetical protein ABFD62_11675 [Syntrophaceae bacterium]